MVRWSELLHCGFSVHISQFCWPIFKTVNVVWFIIYVLLSCLSNKVECVQKMELTGAVCTVDFIFRRFDERSQHIPRTLPLLGWSFLYAQHCNQWCNQKCELEKVASIFLYFPPFTSPFSPFVPCSPFFFSSFSPFSTVKSNLCKKTVQFICSLYAWL